MSLYIGWGEIAVRLALTVAAGILIGIHGGWRLSTRTASANCGQKCVGELVHTKRVLQRSSKKLLPVPEYSAWSGSHEAIGRALR
jgi:hypothetical protein